MNILTKQQYDILKTKYLKHLQMSEQSIAMGLTKNDAIEIFEIYNSLTGEHKKNYSCGRCRLMVFKYLNLKMKEYDREKSKGNQGDKNERCSTNRRRSRRNEALEEGR